MKRKSRFVALFTLPSWHFDFHKKTTCQQTDKPLSALLSVVDEVGLRRYNIGGSTAEPIQCECSEHFASSLTKVNQPENRKFFNLLFTYNWILYISPRFKATWTPTDLFPFPLFTFVWKISNGYRFHVLQQGMDVIIILWYYSLIMWNSRALVWFSVLNNELVLTPK